jgi:hypothetical protein
VATLTKMMAASPNADGKFLSVICDFTFMVRCFASWREKDSVLIARPKFVRVISYGGKLPPLVAFPISRPRDPLLIQ